MQIPSVTPASRLVTSTSSASLPSRTGSSRSRHGTPVQLPNLVPQLPRAPAANLTRSLQNSPQQPHNRTHLPVQICWLRFPARRFTTRRRRLHPRPRVLRSPPFLPLPLLLPTLLQIPRSSPSSQPPPAPSTACLATYDLVFPCPHVRLEIFPAFRAPLARRHARQRRRSRPPRTSPASSRRQHAPPGHFSRALSLGGQFCRAYPGQF
jgi:hypothetical protein